MTLATATVIGVAVRRAVGVADGDADGRAGRAVGEPADEARAAPVLLNVSPPTWVPPVRRTFGRVEDERVGTRVARW